MSEPSTPARTPLIDYLAAQATADLAAVAWTPMFIVALVLALARSRVMTLGALGVAGLLLGILLVPVMVVMRRRRLLLAPDVPPATVDAMVARRRARARSVLHRHAATVAALESHVTTPLLFLTIGVAIARSVYTSNMVALMLAFCLLRAALFLYTGPSRRALPQPPEIGG